MEGCLSANTTQLSCDDGPTTVGKVLDVAFGLAMELFKRFLVSFCNYVDPKDLVLSVT